MNKWTCSIFLPFSPRQLMRRCAGGATLVLLASLGQALGQPTIVSTVPPKGATGISSNSSVVFTFSTSMNTNRTTVTFYTSTSLYTMSNFWNATSNVLTCSPVTAYMVPAQVVWTVSGIDSSGNRLQGTKVGDFFTSPNGASGTNAYTTFVIGRADLYTQAVNGQPTPYLVEPYTYLATTSLASNRTATTGIALTLPSGGVSNLVQDISQPEHWVFGGYMTNEAILETNFPPGNYTFTVNATTSNETKVVAFPSSLVQPSAPQLVNLVAAQAVDSAQPFTLFWGPFVGGTATDFTQAGLTTGWQSPNIGTTNALDGTATSVTIPAGILAPGQTYSASVGFSHYSLATNGIEVTYVYRSTITQFSITTKPATVTVTPVITNGVWSGGVFGFDLLTASGQTVTVVSSTNAASPLATWPIFETITNPGTTIHISDPRSEAIPALFYRVRSGN
jgi:hypothetical protein